MENASKALIMAAEIIIGVMIISIGVYLFNAMGNYSADTTAKMEETQIAQFNNQFLKFYGTSAINGSKPEPIKCTIHDIIGLANLANKSNVANGFQEVQEPSDNLFYIKIDLQIGTKSYKHIETYNQAKLVELVKLNDIIENPETVEPETKYFKCVEAKFGENTKRVNYMKFVEI